MKKILLLLGSVLLISISILFIISNQSGGGFLVPSTTKSSTQLENQTQKVTLLNEKLATSNSQLQKSERENKQLENTTLNTKNEIASATTQIKNLTEELQKTTKEPINDKNQKEIEAIKIKITDLNNELLANKSNLIEQEATYQANLTTIDENQKTIELLTTQINAETNVLQKEVVNFGIGVTRYLMIVFVYWIIYQIYRLLLNRYMKNEALKDILILCGTLITVVATILTLLIAFIGNIALLLTSFGVFSAALVVALQDIVSSIFAWILIQARGPFKKHDTIEIPFQNNTITGVVQSVGFLRTELREKIGGNSLDREEFTGKTILFPNNLILKETFRNLTRDNRILRHQLNYTITFESDYELAISVIKKLMSDTFSYMIDHKDIYLDDIYNVRTIYQPKVFLSISDNGPMITVWYAVRAGAMREILEKISREVLHQFRTHGIDLAYTTTRVISTHDYDKPARFIEPGVGTDIV
jgi:small-conductance mechanosensitive channel